MEITLKEFYEYSKIEIHFFTFELNEFNIEDISYITHPDLTLLTVIHMTCALPVLITPICKNNKCYIDGGVVCNYPLTYCLEKIQNLDEILGFKNQYNNNLKNDIDSESNLLDFIMSFLFKIIYSLSTDQKQPKIKNEIICNASLMSINILKSALTSVDIRKELLESGIQSAKDYITLKNSI
jgi:predicted acylesterase/phospholipase RssA